MVSLTRRKKPEDWKNNERKSEKDGWKKEWWKRSRSMTSILPSSKFSSISFPLHPLLSFLLLLLSLLICRILWSSSLIQLSLSLCWHILILAIVRGWKYYQEVRTRRDFQEKLFFNRERWEGTFCGKNCSLTGERWEGKFCGKTKTIVARENKTELRFKSRFRY